MKVHLDTDLGGDIDDICALALLLHWPGIEITGVTVVGDDKGKRTGYTRYALNIAGRNDIPVAAGADVSGGFFRCELGLPQENGYWPEPIPSSPTPPEEAIELLKKSIEQGAIIVGIGPYTNLYLLDTKYPGILKTQNSFLWVDISILPGQAIHSGRETLILMSTLISNLRSMFLDIQIRYLSRCR